MADALGDRLASVGREADERVLAGHDYVVRVHHLRFSHGAFLPGHYNCEPIMIGWRARIGFLVPPGNPTVEPEVIAMVPRGVSVHFTRMIAHGAVGSHEGLEERTRTMIAHLDETV